MEQLKASQVALALRAWAQENHLYKTEYPVELYADDGTKDVLFDSSAVSALSEATLRQRGITAVGYNDAQNEVIVLTEKLVPAKQLKALPKSVLQKVSIQYVHGGMAHAGNPPTGTTAAPFSIYKGRYACGSSIHPAKIIGAGTLGCLVRDATGALFGLSNNHVSGMCSYAAIGEKILAPGHLDISANDLDPFTIGHHVRSLAMVAGTPENVNFSVNSDAALIKILNDDFVTSMQGALYDTPTAVVSLAAGHVVEKVGRTTGRTKGKVLAKVAGPHPVQYNVQGWGSHVSFFDNVFIIQGENGDPFSQPGDSGSLITTELNGQRYAVGIVFAGNPQGVTFALSLDAILTSLNVSIVSNHNI